ncbi:hypothetical protein SAMN05444920_106259 [Nonomuraea solani]|uniref:Uncharacterized protein n=1 Tax=Nonomuraea solani TaxID=1144553 RepID=A0A1H6DUV1_9ACTN|nr:hypothetical protein [Nonomuraea solani]SEG88533.1 hypothetical protein SAMN05444920_106259 [Nonomuraea solani]
MSTEQKPRKRPAVNLPHIVWLTRSDTLDYGMIGSVKAFSIHFFDNRYNLSTRLPTCGGTPYPPEEFTTNQRARDRAEGIRNEWEQALSTPYKGRLKEAS